MKNIIGSLWVFILIAVFKEVCCEDELVSVVIIYRHGYRTIIDPYPNDPYKNTSYWPEGWGELTNIGKMQHYELGEWFRNRYKNFLPPVYSPSDIYIYSTDVDRTLMSAEADLAGLYPPTKDQVWNPRLSWQPIPVHTIPVTQDYILRMDVPKCPRYDELHKELLNGPMFRNITRQLHDLYAYLTRQSGRLVNSLLLMEYLYSTLYIEDISNYTLPEWTRNVYPDKLSKWANMSFALNTFTPELARLHMGPFYNELVEHFHNVSLNGSAFFYKVRVYSAHDTTIADILNSMGLFEYHRPPFCSTIMFEMRRNANGVHYINMFYKNSTVPQNLTINGCDFDCDFVRFRALLRPLTMTLDEKLKECAIGFRGFLHSNSLLVTLMVSLWIAVLLLVIGLYATAKYFGNRDIDPTYIQIPNEEIS